MKVLYISKASIVPAYQAKLRALADLAEVDALIPARWGADSAGAAHAGRARVHTRAVLLHGHNHLHLYPSAGAELRRFRPDIVHIDEEPYSAVTLQWALSCRRARVPFVFFAWQNLDKDLPPPFGLMRKYVFARAAAAIAGTERAAAVLLHNGFRREVAVIPQLGVDPEHFRPDLVKRAAARARLKLHEGTYVVGFAGRLVAEKGVDLLLDAAAQLPDVVVLIVGEGYERAALERRARELAMRGRVEFIGKVASLDMPIWLNAIDVLVLPSRRTEFWAEQFGRVLIEAMACGAAVIGADSGEIAQVIGDAGLTFPENDAAALGERMVALRNLELRRELSVAGRARVLEYFTHESIARDTMILYRRIFSTAPAARA